MMFWNTSMHCILCVLIIVIKLQYSYTEFDCNFGGNYRTSTHVTNCGIARTPSSSWATISGYGQLGKAPSGQINDGFLVTKLKRPASLQLPNLNLERNSGLLSFHYKYFSPHQSILEVSVCPGGVRVRISGNDRVDWQKIENITVYCDGRTPQIRFFASEIDYTNRIGFDNIKVESTSPPITTATKATTGVTTRKASTTITRASAATTTNTNTTTPGSMTTTPATSELTTSSLSSSDCSTSTSSISTVAFTINTRSSLTTLTLLAFTGRKRATTTVISVSLAAVVIALVIVGIIGITKRKKFRIALCKTKVMQTDGQYMDLEPTNSLAPAYESLGTGSVSKVNETKVLQPTGQCMDTGSTDSPEPTYESVGYVSVSKVAYENGPVVIVEQLIRKTATEDEHQYESIEHQNESV